MSTKCLDGCTHFEDIDLRKDSGIKLSNKLMPGVLI